MLSAFALALCAGGELGLVEVASSPAAPVQSRLALAYPVVRGPSLVAIPGITLGQARVDAAGERRLRNLGASMLLAFPDSSRGRLTVLLNAGLGAEAGRFGGSAFQSSCFLGWTLPGPRDKSWGLGASLSNSATGTSVTPILTWDRLVRRDLRVAGVFPGPVALTWEASTAWKLGTRLAAQGRSWVVDSSRSLTDVRFSTELFVRRKLGPVGLDLAAGWTPYDHRRFVENDREALTIYGFDVFSSQKGRSLPNRSGPVGRIALAFPAW